MKEKQKESNLEDLLLTLQQMDVWKWRGWKRKQIRASAGNHRQMCCQGNNNRRKNNKKTSS